MQGRRVKVGGKLVPIRPWCALAHAFGAMVLPAGRAVLAEEVQGMLTTAVEHGAILMLRPHDAACLSRPWTVSR
jgi:hypothetical protein